VRLLVGDADQLSHLLLRQTKHDPTLADPSADVAVDILWPRSARHLWSRHHSLSSVRMTEECVFYPAAVA
jgi:hypothetical protein